MTGLRLQAIGSNRRNLFLKITRQQKYLPTLKYCTRSLQVTFEPLISFSTRFSGASSNGTRFRNSLWKSSSMSSGISHRNRIERELHLRQNFRFNSNLTLLETFQLNIQKWSYQSSLFSFIKDISLEEMLPKVPFFFILVSLVLLHVNMRTKTRLQHFKNNFSRYF